VASPPIRAFLQRTPRPVLEKPFELGTLSAMVAQVIASDGGVGAGVASVSA
jgi:hypothetical protein